MCPERGVSGLKVRYFMCKTQKKIPDGDSKAMAAAHYAEGRRLWAQGRHGEAITEYNRAVGLDPESPAAVALKMANEVMDFFDPSQLNP